MVIHPGFVKSATTTLQNHLFAAHPQVYLLGGTCQSEMYRQLGSALRGIDGVNYDPRELGRLIAESLSGRPPEKVPVLSDESLTSNACLLYPVACRLHQFFPDARVLFTIRHQLDAIRSFYARHGRVLTNVPGPYADRHVSLESWLAHAYRNVPTSFLGLVDYHTTIRIYHDVFGADRIQVLLFEDLAGDPHAFAGKLSSFLGVDADVSRELLRGRHAHAQESARFVYYDRVRKRIGSQVIISSILRRVPRLREWLSSMVQRGAPQKLVLPEAWLPRLRALYHAGNRSLAETYGLPLQQYDYP